MVALREGTVPVSAGRRLGFAEYGVRGGTPVLSFHGRPGGRSFDLTHSALVKSGARLFVLERPGFGLSDPQPGRQLLDWPGDVAAFADQFGIQRFSVLGSSAGAPYALATAYALPKRVTAVGLQCGWCPRFDDPSLDVLLPPEDRDDAIRYRHSPDDVLRDARARLDDRARQWSENPKGLFDELFGDVVIADPIANERFNAKWMGVLGATYGATPDVDEIRIVFDPWGFALEDVHVPVHAWHGDADQSAPLGLMEHAIAALPMAELTIWPGEGHFLSPAHHADILRFLVANH
jgi:pimeloyl-ACP methyl ester carboxylesterase